MYNSTEFWKNLSVQSDALTENILNESAVILSNSIRHSKQIKIDILKKLDTKLLERVYVNIDDYEGSHVIRCLLLERGSINVSNYFTQKQITDGKSFKLNFKLVSFLKNFVLV